MITKISNQIACYLAQSTQTPEDEEVYSYGIQCFLNEVISDLLLLLFAILFHHVLSTIIWCISFTLIRIHIGGFHASTHERCILLGTLVGVSFFWIHPIWLLFFPIPVYLVILYSLLIAILFAPILHPHHPVKPEQRKQAHQKAILYILLESLLFFVIYLWNPIYAAPIISGMLCASGMAGLQLLINLFLS